MSRPRRPLTFYKMHGLGNDFMVLDAVTHGVQLDPQTVADWGDRRTGVGFDQLLLIEPPTSSEADFWYRIYNADGTSAEQCGNGTRAVALLARHLGLSKKTELNWQSAAGFIKTRFISPQQIETTMTVPELATDQIPFDPSAARDVDGQTNRFEIRADGACYDVTAVSMGNPHAVMFLDNVFEADVDTIGAALTVHPAFPNGANIGFCQVIDRQFLRLRVFERGVGETRACGSGACAAVVAARLRDLVDARVKVSLPGGKLRITWPGGDSPVTMTGAATLIYRGEIET